MGVKYARGWVSIPYGVSRPFRPTESRGWELCEEFVSIPYGVSRPFRPGKRW